MKYLYGSLILFWLMIDLILKPDTNIIGIASILGVLCLFIIKEKYIDFPIVSLIFVAAALILVKYNSSMVLLAGIPLHDSLFKKNYYTFGISLAAILYLCTAVSGFDPVLPLLLGAITGHIAGVKDKKEKKFLSILDDERNLRYQLEQTKNQLVNSRKEIERLTEIKERNRIAREIHDNIGHNIAGILFQLQAAVKLLNKDRDKSEDILKLCVEKLSETLETTRKTVYNIKTEQKTGLQYIERIINNYQFCEVEFEHKGNFNLISSSMLELLEANIKEALTNTTKHSNASKVVIRLDINEKYIRFYYKDDGNGCNNIKDNVGLSGMKERASNVGGTISIDGNNGFLIVCNVPNT